MKPQIMNAFALAFPPLAKHTVLTYLHIFGFNSKVFTVFASDLHTALPPNIKLLSLVFDESFKPAFAEQHEITWNKVDTVLNGSRFKNLEYLVIWTHSQKDSFEAIQATLLNTFPKLCKLGILWWGDEDTQTGKIKNPFLYHHYSPDVQLFIFLRMIPKD